MNSRRNDGRADEVVNQIDMSRRAVLLGVGWAGVLGPLGRATARQESEHTDIVLDGHATGWTGVRPAEIAGETNPLLSLAAGEIYHLVWENVDGQPHNFVIEDSNHATIVESPISNEGVQTVLFEASTNMAEYYCGVHPVSMRGGIEFEEDAGRIARENEDHPVEDDPPRVEPDDEAGVRFFPEGPAVGVRTVGAGMTAPTDLAEPPGADDRLFVTDQTGEVWVLTEEGRLDEPFLDVGDRMVTIGEEFAGSFADPGQEYDERGLLGIEFHPAYEDNGRFFLNYSAPPDESTPAGWSHVQVIAEFEAGPSSQEGRAGAATGDAITEAERRAVPKEADPDSERRVMEIPSPQYNHNGGPMTFGPDGFLYVPMGDGGGENDEMEGHVDDWYDGNAGGNGQDTQANLLGGIHRIDVDSAPTESPRTDAEGPVPSAADEGYALPDDNPLVDQPDHLSAYYSWGWRNPSGISFDRDGRLIVADRGQERFETAYEVEMGGNYGWNVREGTNCFSTETPGEPPVDCPDRTPAHVRGGEALLAPVVEYPQTFQGRRLGTGIVGGHVYEADTLEALRGTYVFGDWTQDGTRAEPAGRLFVATIPERERPGGTDSPSDGRPTVSSEHHDYWELEAVRFDGSEDGRLHRFVRQFGRDRDGEVYVLVSERAVPFGDTGTVFQLVQPEAGEELNSVDS